ncbi:MAG: PASTA domain-containing protein [Acidimicrobiales bacterium]
MTMRFLGLPAIVWIGAAAVVAFWWFSRQSGGSAGQAGSATGGSGTIDTGATTIDSGAVQITVSQGQPQPPVTGTKGGHSVAVPNVTGQRVILAQRKLAGAGFRSKAPPLQKGKTMVVTGETPKAGTKAPKGSLITLTSKTET